MCCPHNNKRAYYTGRFFFHEPVIIILCTEIPTRVSILSPPPPQKSLENDNCTFFSTFNNLPLQKRKSIFDFRKFIYIIHYYITSGGKKVELTNTRSSFATGQTPQDRAINEYHPVHACVIRVKNCSNHPRNPSSGHAV